MEKRQKIAHNEMSGESETEQKRMGKYLRKRSLAWTAGYFFELMKI